MSYVLLNTRPRHRMPIPTGEEGSCMDLSTGVDEWFNPERSQTYRRGTPQL